MKISRTSRRKDLVPGQETSHCPDCGNRLEFRTDGNGRSIEYCECGHQSPIGTRSGNVDPEAGDSTEST